MLALGGLVVSSPLLFLAAVLIMGTSPGPVLFRQQRMGQFGKTFELFKFRSMRLENAGAQVTAKGRCADNPRGAIASKKQAG